MFHKMLIYITDVYFVVLAAIFSHRCKSDILAPSSECHLTLCTEFLTEVPVTSGGYRGGARGAMPPPRSPDSVGLTGAAHRPTTSYSAQQNLEE